MGQHVIAALGPAGPIRLVELVNQGACTPVVVALARTVGRRSVVRPVGVGSHVTFALLAEPHDRPRTCASARAAGGPTLAPVGWPGWPVIHARRSGRCWPAISSRAVRAA